MTPQNKKTITLIAIVVIAVIGIAGVLFVSARIASERSVSPTAPESKPQAAEWVSGEMCGTRFRVGAVAVDNATESGDTQPIEQDTLVPVEGEEQAPIVADDGTQVGGTFVETKE